MVPINIGLDTGAGFGSSDILSNISEYSTVNFNTFSNWTSRNPTVFQNDSIFVRMATLMLEYRSLKLSVKDMLPALSQSLGLVHRVLPQELHSTHLGKLLIIPEHRRDDILFKVLYSDSTDVSYDGEAIIDTCSFVSINVRVLSDLVYNYTKMGKSFNSLISSEITPKLTGLITNYAIFNCVTGIGDIKLLPPSQTNYRIINLNKIMYMNRKSLLRKVNNLDTTPVDVLRNVPTGLRITFDQIEDHYIDNLLWINLIGYKKIVDNGQRINKDGFYSKYYRSYSLYKPRGRGDSYFSKCSTELLDRLQDSNLI